MICEFEVKVKVAVDSNEKDNTKAKHIHTKFTLDISKNLDPSAYNDPSGLPTKNGCNAITQTLIQGLLGNIHTAHQQGYRDSAEHLRYIISKLEEGFIQVPDIRPDKYEG